MGSAAPEGPARPTRLQTAIWCAIVGSFLLLSLRDYLSFQIGAYQDDASYVVLARSLVEADRYGLINVPGEPDPARFPFGYPLLLSPLALLFPDLPDTLKSLSLFATVLNLGLIFWFWRTLTRIDSYWCGLAVCGLYGLSPLTVEYSRMVMSEAVFVSWCLLALILVERYRADRSTPAWHLLTGIAMAFVVFTRTVGAVMVVVAVAYLPGTVGRIAWKDVSVMLILMLLVLGLIIALTPVDLDSLSPGEYAHQLRTPEAWGHGEEQSGLVSRMLGSFGDYAIRQLRQLVLSIGEKGRIASIFERLGVPYLLTLAGCATFAVVALGWLEWWRRAGLSAALLFAVAYSGVLLLWPWHAIRFLYPLQPQIYLGVFLGFQAVVLWILSFRRGLRLRTLTSVALVTGFSVLATLSILKSANIEDTRPHVGDLAARTAWIRSYAEPEATILSEYPQTDFLYSKRHTIAYPRTPTLDELTRYLEANNVDLILVAPELRWQSEYKPVHSPRTELLRGQLATLTAERRVELVYESTDELIRVFRVQ